MLHSPRHIVVVGLAAAAAFLAAAAPAAAAPVCGEGTYAYAGFALDSVTHGVSAAIEQAGPLDVRAGHVAGWIGVVNRDSSAWLQTGLSALPGDATSQIYYEVACPGPRARLPRRAPVHRHRQAAPVRRARARAPPQLVARRGGRTAGHGGDPSAGQPQPVDDAGTRRELGGEDDRRVQPLRVRVQQGVAARVRYRNPAGLTGSPQKDPNYTLVRRSPSSFVATSVGGPISA